MEKNRIVICAAGTGNPYFSTDTASALRAAELECQIIYKATQVDGIYDKDPNVYKKAKRFKKMSYENYLSKNLKVLDSAAVSIARDNEIPIKIFFNLIITFIRVMVLKINNQLTQRIYFYDIQNFRRFVLQLLLFSYKDQYHTHQSLQLHHAFEHLHLRY